MKEYKNKTAFPPVAGLCHVAIRTKDIHKSIHYYTNVLGLKEAFRMFREDGSLGTVYLSVAKGQYLELFPDAVYKTGAGPDTAGVCHLCLTTNNIRRSYQTVSDAGGPLDSEIRTGKSRCLMFWTHDPDGTQIEIMEMPPESLQAQADKKLQQFKEYEE